MSKPKYILDSYALLAYFQGEPAGAKVRDILKNASKGSVSAYLSVISLGEIYYIIERKRGEEKAIEIIDDVFRLPVDLVDATTKRVLGAAHVKARHPNLLCGCICGGGSQRAFCDHRHRRSGIQAH